MSLTESIVEDAANACGTLTPALCLRPSPLRSGSHGERESRQGKLVGRLREAIGRLTPAIPDVIKPHL